MKYVRPISKDSDAEAAGPWSADGDMLESFPALAEFLGEGKWEDGSPRATGTVLVFCEAGKLKACLNDRDSEMNAFYAADSWAGLWDGLEAKLRNGGLDWRRKGTWKRK